MSNQRSSSPRRSLSPNHGLKVAISNNAIGRSSSISPSGRIRSPQSGRRSPNAASGLLSNIGLVPTPSFKSQFNTNKFDKVKKNSKGGVLITPEEIQLAFSMLDVEKNGTISLPNLKKRLGVLFPDITGKEYRFLMNNKKEMVLDDLKDLLLDNEITNFDPVTEAFKLLEARDDNGIPGSGNGNQGLQPEKLKQAFMSYGFGEINEEELAILTRTADIDNDGIISVEDFRAIIDYNTVKGGKAVSSHINNSTTVSPTNLNNLNNSSKPKK
eukprot:gene10431-14012_t